METCFDFFSGVWMGALRVVRPVKGTREASMEIVLDSLTSRQIHIEIQDRRSLAEARRYHASGAKALFRAKMLEHRRLQAQLAQLQRYRENVLAQMDAMSNHEINQTFMMAMKNASRTYKQYELTKQDAVTTIDEMHESMNDAKELTDILGQPLGVDVLDEELEQEFLEEEPIAAALPEPAQRVHSRQPVEVEDLISPLVAA
jgi:hypothetical protein